MSELKEHLFCECDECIREYSGPLSNEMRPYYLKSEADKVIAESDKKIDELEKRIADGDKDFEMANHQNERLLKIVRHHKYRRCLAMAKSCEERFNYLTCLENWQLTDKEYQQVIGDYWDRWHKRWMELSEKFKEDK